MKFLLIYLLFIVNIYANQIKGKVIHISDGDTIHILTTEKEKYKIRLNDIDAPESKQAFGNKSKENLKKIFIIKT
jgi:endonuclease YncB( thermonuclease family)